MEFERTVIKSQIMCKSNLKLPIIAIDCGQDALPEDFLYITNKHGYYMPTCNKSDALTFETFDDVQDALAKINKQYIDQGLHPYKCYMYRDEFDITTQKFDGELDSLVEL